MLVRLTSQQRDALVRFVDEEIAALGPEIHHTRTYKDDLKEQRRELKGLRDALQHPVGETAESAASSAPVPPVGLA